MKRGIHGLRHAGHHYLHEHHRKAKEIREHEYNHAKRSVGQLVSATIEGQLVSWTNLYAGPGFLTNMASSAGTPVAMHIDEANGSAPESTTEANAKIATSSPAAATPSPPNSPTVVAASVMAASHASSGLWVREAYYSAGEGTTQGITFLNHFGGVNGVPGTSAGGAA